MGDDDDSSSFLLIVAILLAAAAAIYYKFIYSEEAGGGEVKPGTPKEPRKKSSRSSTKGKPAGKEKSGSKQGSKPSKKKGSKASKQRKVKVKGKDSNRKGKTKEEKPKIIGQEADVQTAKALDLPVDKPKPKKAEPEPTAPDKDAPEAGQQEVGGIKGLKAKKAKTKPEKDKPAEGKKAKGSEQKKKKRKEGGEQSGQEAAVDVEPVVQDAQQSVAPSGPSEGVKGGQHPVSGDDIVDAQRIPSPSELQKKNSLPSDALHTARPDVPSAATQPTQQPTQEEATSGIKGGTKGGQAIVDPDAPVVLHTVESDTTQVEGQEAQSSAPGAKAWPVVQAGGRPLITSGPTSVSTEGAANWRLHTASSHSSSGGGGSQYGLRETRQEQRVAEVVQMTATQPAETLQTQQSETLGQAISTEKLAVREALHTTEINTASGGENLVLRAESTYVAKELQDSHG